MPTAHREIFLACNLRSFDAPQDDVQQAPVKIWASNKTIFRIAAFAGAPGTSTIVDDVSDWATVTVSIVGPVTNGVAPDPDGTITTYATASTSSFTAAPTYANWQARTAWHASVSLTSEEMALAAGTYWLVVSMTDTSGEETTFVAGTITITQDGYNGGGSAPAITATTYTKAQADARYVQLPYTGLTGGTASDLDSELTPDLALNSTVRFAIVSGVLSAWQLISGTNAEDVSGGIIRPDDYATTTNERVWRQCL